MYQWQRFKEKSIWRKNGCKLSNWGQVQLTNDDLHFLSDVGTTLAPSHWHHHHHHKLHHLSGWKAAPMINDDHKHHLFELRPTSPSNKCRIYSCNWPPKLMMIIIIMIIIFNWWWGWWEYPRCWSRLCQFGWTLESWQSCLSWWVGGREGGRGSWSVKN